MARFFYNPLIFCIFFLLFQSNAQDIDHNSKTTLVNGILQKVFNLTLSSFANIPIEEREKMLIKIEEKLNKSAEFLGPKSEKYVALIMEGVKSITSKNASPNSFYDTRNEGGIEGHSEIEGKQIFRTMEDKNERYKKIAEKIRAIADVGLKYAKTPKDRENIVKKIEMKVDSAIKKHVSLNKQPLFNRDMLMQNVIKMLQEKGKKYNAKDDSEKNEARRMEFEFIDNVNVNNEIKAENTPRKSNKVLYIGNSGDIDKIEPIYKNVTLKLPCQTSKTFICDKIKALRVLKCSGKDMSVEKLCNGIDDCFDYSDEQDCAIQGVDKVRNASQIMSDIDNSLAENCYTSKIDDSLIAKQNEILRHVLQSQLIFIQKHASIKAIKSTHSNLRKSYSEPESVRRTVNEVAVVITTLSTALERTLCSSTIEEDTRKFNDIVNLDKEIEKKPDEIDTTWSTKSCKCIEEYCIGECSENCETVCSQRYQISKWQCNAVSKKKSISLDLICDGKLDCYDETDESGCTTALGFDKFEAVNLYNLVIDMIKTKSKLTSVDSIRNQLNILQKLIERLLKLTTQRKVNVMTVKSLRNQGFSVMTSIYELARSYVSNMDLLNDMFLFLMSVNEKLIGAMKRSHVGNDRIIGPDGCFCRGNKCALLKCSEACIRACPVEPKLTRYFCGGSMVMNQSIPIEAICNGKDDCPDRDDENDCSSDICRRHHLVVLRHNLQDYTKGKQASSIADALHLWALKVSSRLLVLETNERPTPKVFRDIVKDLLHDLVMAYASLSNHKRRNNDDVIDQFYRTALVVMSSLKSCSK